MTPHSLIALLHGPDRPGLVARTAGWIFERGGNILHADQHRDADEGVFFQRIEWLPPAHAPFEQQRRDFESFARNELGMDATVACSDRVPRLALFVSSIPHCCQDIILRVFTGELRAEIACVVSNHEALRPFAEKFGLPFFHTPITPATKATTEQHQLAILRDTGAHVVLLARYMQILSASFLSQSERPVINIHHSFLPAFAGARPYHQAHARGVKIIGATAHYATEQLDEGPIIAQETAHVSHRSSVADLIARGRELEKFVFARAVSLHLQHRVLRFRNKTVVFD